MFKLLSLLIALGAPATRTLTDAERAKVAESLIVDDALVPEQCFMTTAVTGKPLQVVAGSHFTKFFIALVRDGKVIARREDEYYFLDSILSVAFIDVNHDGKRDVIGLFNAYSGHGPKATELTSRVITLLQTKSGAFVEASGLDETLSSQLPAYDATILDVKKAMKRH